MLEVCCESLTCGQGSLGNPSVTGTAITLDGWFKMGDVAISDTETISAPLKNHPTPSPLDDADQNVLVHLLATLGKVKQHMVESSSWKGHESNLHNLDRFCIGIVISTPANDVASAKYAPREN